MKQLKIILLFAMCMISLHAYSVDAVEIDGIYYNIITKGNIAEVTSNPNGYTGSVDIPKSVSYEGNDYRVTKIGDNAFQNCTGLTSVTIPNSVTNIGNGAFDGCRGLISVTIPNSVTSISNSAFSGCSSLTSVTIPNSVTGIGSQAFSSCTGLISITIPNSVTSIGDFAFSGCSSLISVTIPNSVTSIGWNTFYGCSSLTSVTIPNSVTSIGYSAFRECFGLTSVTIPNSVTSIGILAFSGCSSLISVTIPNSVTSIGNSAFYGCSSLTSATIGSGVKNIGIQTFGNCSKLETVTCLAENVPYTNADAFLDSYIGYATLIVPAASLNAYKTTVPWSSFGTFKTIGGQDVQKCATPTISYGGKKLTFSCETEGVSYVYDIKDADIKQGYDSEVTLTATYEISVYATKSGYENSDVATATLVWNSASFTETTQPATAITPAAEFMAMPVLIQSNGGMVTVQGAEDGTPVSIYTSAGMHAGSTVSHNGMATLNTSLQTGSIAIIKIGERTVKVIMK